MLTIVLEGHLSRASLDGRLEPVRAALSSSTDRAGMLFDCRTMDSYDFDARTAYVEFIRAYRDRLACVAIVTEKLSWRVVIATMALAAGVDMRPFATLDAAATWLGGRA